MAEFSPPIPTTLTLAPGEQRNIDGPSVFARPIAATGAFNISFDNGQSFSTNLGLAYVCLPGESFNRVTVSNPGAAAVNLTILTGRMIVKDDRLNIVTAPVILPVTEPITKLVGQNISALAAAAAKILTGVPGAGQYQRAGVLVDNLDAALSLTIYDQALNIAGFVLPGSSRYIPLSGWVKIQNDNGAAVNCGISEIWQLSP